MMAGWQKGQTFGKYEDGRVAMKGKGPFSPSFFPVPLLRPYKGTGKKDGLKVRMMVKRGKAAPAPPAGQAGPHRGRK